MFGGMVSGLRFVGTFPNMNIYLCKYKIKRSCEHIAVVWIVSLTNLQKLFSRILFYSLGLWSLKCIFTAVATEPQTDDCCNIQDGALCDNS